MWHYKCSLCCRTAWRVTEPSRRSVPCRLELVVRLPSAPPRIITTITAPTPAPAEVRQTPAGWLPPLITTRCPPRTSSHPIFHRRFHRHPPVTTITKRHHLSRHRVTTSWTTSTRWQVSRTLTRKPSTRSTRQPKQLPLPTTTTSWRLQRCRQDRGQRQRTMSSVGTATLFTWWVTLIDWGERAWTCGVGKAPCLRENIQTASVSFHVL